MEDNVSVLKCDTAWTFSMFGEGWTNEHTFIELHSHQKPVNLNMSRWSYSPSGPTEMGTAKTGWGIVIVEYKLAGLWHNLCSFLAQLAPTTPTRKGNHIYTTISKWNRSGNWTVFAHKNTNNMTRFGVQVLVMVQIEGTWGALGEAVAMWWPWRHLRREIVFNIF